MSRDNSKKYPRTIESKNSYLRIRAPEHLDVALEGLIRKVLKEQPKMDDIYAFAADYFDMLLKLREKSGIRKLSVQDICPHHNEEDADEMIKLASTFTKRKKEAKPASRTYRPVSLKHGDHRHGKGPKIKEGDLKTPKNGERFNTVLPIVSEHPELEDAKPAETAVKNGKPDSDTEDSDLDFVVQPKSQDPSENIIEAREVILEEEGEDDENAVESGIGTVGDIKEIRDKIKVVENEIKSLEKRESEVGGEGNSTVEEVKVEDKDVNTIEATPIVEEPLQETGDEKLRVENEVTIQEVTAEEENANAEEAGTKTLSEGVVEEGQAEIEDAEEKTEEEQEKLEVIAEETEEGKTSDEIAKEEVEESESGNAPEPNTEEETAGEKANDEVAVQETQEETQDSDTQHVEAAEETVNDEVVLQEEPQDPSTQNVEETVEDKANDEVKIQEMQEETQDSQTQPEEETATKAGEPSEESAETEPSPGDREEDSDAKPEVESAVEETPDTEANKDNTAEESKEPVERAENDIMEEANPNADSTVVEMRSAGTTEAKEAELMGGYESKEEKLETEEFLKLEKESEEVQNAEPSGEPTEVGPANEPVTDNTETTAEDDTVVITAAEIEDEKSVEVEDPTPTDENKDTEDIKSVAEEGIAVAGGVGAAAAIAILQHAKRELTDEKPEETDEKEEAAEEVDQKPSAEKVLLEGEPENEEMTLTQEVQKFLDRERQHSSYDKETEELSENQKTENPEVEVMSETLPGALARMTLPEKEVKDEETAENVQSGPSDVEAEWDDQEREGSTTSGEIEFEISPMKYPEQDKTIAEAEENDTVNVPADEGNEEGKPDVIPEPRIVVELNGSESTDDNTVETNIEPMQVFLSVPKSVGEEYPARKPVEDASQQDGHTISKRSVDAPEEEEAIIDCANIGNEIIQTGKVQKVELIEGDEDILQVHLTTTIETVQESGDSLLVQMTSKIDPTFEVSMETRVESPVLDDKMRLVRAAIVIQNGFRRFRRRKATGEPLDASKEELSIVSETKLDLSMQTFLKDTSSRESESSFSSSATKINSRDFKGRNLSRSATRTLLETHSLDPIRKVTPLKTRSLSSVRYGVADFEVWNQLVKELEEAATKIQSNYRGYKTRKKLQRGNAIQSTTTTTSEESSVTADTAEVHHRHTGEFHDSIVLPLPPK